MDETEAEFLAASLRKIESTVQRPARPGIHQIWYRGKEPYFDVFFELAEGTGILDWFQLTLRGRAITWQTGRLWTGETHETDVQPDYPSTKNIDEDEKLDREFAAEVLLILEARGEDDHFQLARSVIAAYLV